MPIVKTKDGDKLISEKEGELFPILMGLKMAGKRTDDLVVGEDEVPAEEWLNDADHRKSNRRIVN